MKECVVCHSLTFDDMDICYECMSPLHGARVLPGTGVNGVPQAMLGERVPLKGVSGVSRYGEVSAYSIDAGADGSGLDVEELLEAVFGPDDTSPGMQGGERPSGMTAPPSGASPEEASIGWVVRVVPGSGRAWTKRFPSQTGRISIGRSSDNDIKVRDLHVSRHHAELAFSPEGIWLKDLDSRNMTFADGVPVLGSRKIAEGTSIRIGGAELTVDASADARPRPS